MKSFITALTFAFSALVAVSSYSQMHKTNTASIRFFSEIGKISATNTAVKSSLNAQNGELKFTASILNFSFKNKMMQGHFNEEDVMNSHTFPEAKFVGMITNNTTVEYDKIGTYPINVKGKLTIKGVTKELTVKATIEVKDNGIHAHSTFTVDRFQYNVTGNEKSVSQIMEISVDVHYE